MIPNTPDEIETAVEWFYRARVKRPPDTIAALAAEAGLPEHEIAEAIAETIRLLDLVTVEDCPDGFRVM